MTMLYGPQRHEPLAGDTWSESAARAAIERWASAAYADFVPNTGWAAHPSDDADPPNDPMHFLYCGSGGAIWALEHLADAGVIVRQQDFKPFVAGILDRHRANSGQPPHGTQSFLLGDSGLLLLQWKMDRSDAAAQRLYDAVQANLHNPAREPLWGSPGSVLAAIAMAEGCRPRLHRQCVPGVARCGLHRQHLAARLCRTRPDSRRWTLSESASTRQSGPATEDLIFKEGESDRAFSSEACA